MFFYYKNKGILIPLYLTASIIGVALLMSVLKSYVSMLSNINLDAAFVVGLGLIVAGLWSYLTHDSYYITADGARKPMHEDNTFFFIPMKLWGYIFLATGIACVIGGILTMLKIIEE